MEVIPTGSDVRARLVQPWKAKSPMEVIPAGSDVRARLVQPAKAKSPMEVILSGIVMFVRFVRNENPLSAIMVTGSPLYIAGIITCAAVAEPLETEYAVLSFISVKNRPGVEVAPQTVITPFS
jgi:hypothetical protein